MIDPDRINEEALPELPLEGVIALAEIDMAIDEIIRSLDDCIGEWVDEVDRTLVIHHLRMAWIQGYEDRHRDAQIT